MRRQKMFKKYTVVGFYESTGETFGSKRTCEDVWEAMRREAITRKHSADVAIVGAVDEAGDFTPACDDSRKLAYACDLQDCDEVVQ